MGKWWLFFVLGTVLYGNLAWSQQSRPATADKQRLLLEDIEVGLKNCLTDMASELNEASYKQDLQCREQAAERLFTALQMFAELKPDNGFISINSYKPKQCESNYVATTSITIDGFLQCEYAADVCGDPTQIAPTIGDSAQHTCRLIKQLPDQLKSALAKLWR